MGHRGELGSAGGSAGAMTAPLTGIVIVATCISSLNILRLTHHRVEPKPVGVIDAFVAGKTREDRLTREPGETVPAILPDAWVGDQTRRRVAEAERIIQLPVQEQSALRADR